MALRKTQIPAALRLLLLVGVLLVAFAGNSEQAQAICKDPPCPLPPEGEFTAALHTEVSGPLTAFRDQDLTYSISVSNGGVAPAHAVELEIDVPAGATYVSGPATCTTGTRNGHTIVSCPLGTLRPGNGQDTSVTVRPNVVGALVITGTALSETPEDDPGDDTDSLTTQVAPPPQPYADIAASLTDSPDPVTVGRELTYHARVTNNSVILNAIGPNDFAAPAQNVRLTDVLPAGVDFVNTSRPGDCGTTTTETGRTRVACNLGTVDPNFDFEDVDIVVRPTTTGPLGNTVTASSDTQDPDSGNNAASTTTEVRSKPTVSIDDVSTTEGTSADRGEQTFQVSLSRPAEETTSVAINTEDGSARSPEDYWSTAGQIVFNTGEQTKNWTVPVIADAVDEPDETYSVVLANATGATIADGTATGTILDDDDGPALSVAGTSAIEGDEGTGPANFTVSLSHTSAFDVSVDASTENGTATAGADYTGRSGRVTIPAGQLSVTVPVDVLGDSKDEPDEEFTLELSDPARATIGGGAAHATIVDDDAAPTLSVADISTPEGDFGASPASFTVALSEASGFDVEVDVATQDGSATAPTASRRGDYTPRSDVVTIPAGETTADVRVDVLGDTRDEPDEDFTLDLGDASRATVDDGTARATIVDDDDPGDAPETSIESGPGEWSTSPTPRFELLASEDEDTFECRVVPADFASCTTPHRTRPLPDGEHTFEVRAVKHEVVDTSGGIQSIPDPTPARATFKVDTVAPTTTIAAAPPAVGNNASPAFELRSDEPLARFECHLSAVTPFRACAARETFARLADGEYVFEARAVDPAGNVASSPATHSFVIDTTPPETRIGSRRPPMPPTVAGAGGTNRVGVGGSGQALLAVGCPGDAGASCEGDVAFDANGVRIGQSGFTVAPGQTEDVPVDLPSGIQSAVERRGDMKVVTTMTLEEPAAKRTTGRRAARVVARKDMVLTPDPRTPRVRDAGRTLRTRGGAVAVRLACPRERADGCRGSLNILTTGDRVLGLAGFRLKAGQSRSVKVKLYRSARRMLRPGRSLEAVLYLATRQAGGEPVVKRVQINLRGGRR